MEQFTKKMIDTENKIGYVFKNKALLKNALTHRSFRSTNPKIKSNERIEFLGDAVLELVVTEVLYQDYPNYNEGELTKIRSALVRTEMLNQVMKQKKINENIFLSVGERKSGGREKGYILANVYESIVGAIYLDGGFVNAQKFINSTILHRVKNVINNKTYIDPKTHLQEISQSKYKQIPLYRIVGSQGLEHEKVFTAEVSLNGKIIATGKGLTKQRAEEQCAKKALKILKK